MMYKVMVVDDEKLTRDFLKIKIPELHPDWEVTALAEDGKVACEKYENIHFDLILTDIKMPTMDGLELCRVVKEKNPNQKIMILSGYNEFHLAQEAIAYGVKEYLLKPLIMEELFSAIDKITRELISERDQASEYKTIQLLSEDSKQHIIRTYLKAIITGNHLELNALEPVVSKWKVNLMANTGVIMIMSLDGEHILDQNVPYKDIPIYHYILNRIAKETVEDQNMGKIAADEFHRTIILLTGEERQLEDLISHIHVTVSNALQKYTNLTMTSSVGRRVTDILQLQSSYNLAKTAWLSKLKDGGDNLYLYDEHEVDLQLFSDVLNQNINDIISGYLNNNERIYATACKEYIDLMSDTSKLSVYRYGYYLIKKIVSLDNTYEKFEDQALKRLKIPDSQKTLTKEEIIDLFQSIIKLFMVSPSTKDTQQDIISQAKRYIYTHYGEPLSLSLLADEVGVTSSYLSNSFHKNAGESYIKFLTRVRMEQAAKFLKIYPHAKIYDIAEKVGYTSVKHFSQIFKQYYHMPPGKFQQKKSN
ncbi:response regulator [Gracilibacillus sp. YIM 98692]|uniref:response regulator transcription factor n=1 Tax=Gracilibacillus sp. YIM 98692 TaxID=2663532 RepID=UPI0013D3A8D9|nr:response regulator [Gracilibacillus sp. YIM 98692]